MKFTKEEAFEKLKGILTNNGKKTLRMSEKSIEKQLENLMPLVANEEMELSDFVEKVKNTFSVMNSNAEKDNADFVKEWEKNHPASEHPKDEPKKDDEPSDAMAALFPDIPIVIDRFHVIKELLKVLEHIRKGISCKIKEQKERASLKNNRFLILASSENLTEVQYKRIQELFKEYPQFETPYLLKEAFRSIYATAKTKTEAEKMYKEWCESCHEENIMEFDGFMATVSNWHDEIFAYFDLSGDNRTNTQTESLNNRIKEIAGNGRGYSFDILRDKAVFMKETTRPYGHFDFTAFDNE